MDDLARLEAAVADLSRKDDPDRWAMAQYRLGLARSETASTPDEITSALAMLDQAGRILTAERAPLEHSRILTVAANCLRMLGRRDRAAELFAEAAGLAESRTSPSEVASTLLNVGLIHSEAGRTSAALEPLNRAIELLTAQVDHVDRADRVDGADIVADRVDGGAEASRLLGAALVNRAQALQASGGATELLDAIADYGKALAIFEPDSAQAAMASHGLGTAHLEQHRRSASPESLDAAVRALQKALSVFTASAFPFQHAIARHSLAVAVERSGRTEDLPRALHHLEAALTILDPRLHATQWQTANDALARVTAALDALHGPRPRMAHVARHLTDASPTERTDLLRERLGRLTDLPDSAMCSAADALADSLAELPLDGYRKVLPELLGVLMELPEAMLDAAAASVCQAHQASSDTESLDRALDEAIHDTLFGPQRVRVRDLLESYGWRRW